MKDHMKVSLSQVLKGKHQPFISTDFPKIRLPEEDKFYPDWAHTIISDHTDASNIRVTQDNNCPIARGYADNYACSKYEPSTKFYV